MKVATLVDYLVLLKVLMLVEELVEMLALLKVLMLVDYLVSRLLVPLWANQSASL